MANESRTKPNHRRAAAVVRKPQPRQPSIGSAKTRQALATARLVEPIPGHDDLSPKARAPTDSTAPKEMPKP